MSTQLKLFDSPMNPANLKNNQMSVEDSPIHDWYRFVLSFPPHLVRDYLKRMQVPQDGVVLDPFCGTGTTLVEAKKSGYRSVGIEANSVAHFASKTKVNWDVSPEDLLKCAREIAQVTRSKLLQEGIDDDSVWNGDRSKLLTLPIEAAGLLLKDSISPVPLHKTLKLLSEIKTNSPLPFQPYLKLALARALYSTIGNLRFGPEVGVGKIKSDVAVVSNWLNNVLSMSSDLRIVSAQAPESAVFLDDARNVANVLRPQSIDAVITSPPYPNEKDYTRTTRLESVILGFVSDKQGLRAVKKGLIRSNTRGVYKGDSDDEWVSHFPQIQSLAEQIEQRRVELNKNSGFEKLYAKVTKLYFGGMARHLSDLKPFLKPGAKLAYVVGDQASYLRVMIRTGQLLADIATDLGYEIESIDLFRTRMATVTREQMREEVVVMKWKG